LIDRQSDRLVAFVGKMIPAKGLEMLIGAWPYVVARIPDARLCVAGFGSLRPRLEKLCESLADADLRGLQAVAAGSGPEQELSYLQAFIAGLGGSSRRLYLDWAPYAAGRINFLGRLEHSELAPLLSACEALVVPSTFFEAFGMVACEAAACGALPVCAAHSGLYEVVETLQSALDSDLAALMSFELGPESVSLIADKLGAWLSLDLDRQRIARQRLAENAHSRYGLTQVAQRVASACLGVTDGLARP
jgi:glycosyltransferase involved in cell wall biosynthesis